MKTIILIANGCEESEALVTYDLLFRAKIDVKLVGLEKEIISSHDVKIIPHLTIDEINEDEIDCLVLPGGLPGTYNLENDARVSKLIDNFVEQDKLISAICAAPGILVRKGLLNDNEFICYPGHESNKIPAKVIAIKKGNIITSKALGTVFEFAHLIIETLTDKENADNVFKQIML